MATTVPRTFAVLSASLVVTHLLAPAFLFTMPAAATSRTETGGLYASPPDAANNAIKGVVDAFDNLPLRFEENQAQGTGVKFVARGSGVEVGITPTEVMTRLHTPEKIADTSPSSDLPSRIKSTLEDDTWRPSLKPSPTSALVRIQLVGANRRARVIGENRLATRSNYFIGNDPRRWRTDVANYERVRVEQVYPGVDVVYYGSGQQLEYDFEVAPGADFKAIRLRLDGAQGGRLDNAGELVIKTASGEIRQRRPEIYQVTGGVRRLVSGGYAVKGGREVGFYVGNYDPSRPLVIDPILSYVSVIANGNASAIAVDAAGSAYIAGFVGFGLPTTPGAFQTNSGGGICAELVCSDGFVAKLNPAGNALLYCTYLGGSGSDFCNGIVVDSTGNAYVTGNTNSKDFPITRGAFQTVFNVGEGPYLTSDAFVTKLDPSGSALVYSTYLGGSENDEGLAIAVDSLGSAYVTGDTLSRNFPTTADARQTVFTGGTCSQSEALFCTDAFVTKLNAGGSATLYSTFLGGNGADQGTGIAVDASGSAYVTGRTSSANFPTTPGALQPAYRGELAFGDAFVTKLNPAGSDFVYSTYLGGSGRDSGKAIAVDLAGNVYVTGLTGSTNFPVTPGVFQPSSASSSFYKSTSGGNGWSNATSGLPTEIAISSLVIDPATTSTLYAGTYFGIYKSADGGTHWAPSRLFNFSVGALAIDPKNPATLYAGKSNYVDLDFYKSTDGGDSWRGANFSAELHVTFVTGIVIDPQDSQIVYVSTNVSGQRNVPQGVFKSTDGGTSWITVSDDLPSFNITDVRGLVINPANPTTLYASAGRLYKTTNSGLRWKLTDDFPSPPFSIIADPKNSNVLYAATSAGIFKGGNAGKKWNLLNAGPPGLVNLIIHPSDPSIAYAGTYGGVIYRSTNAGSDWTAISSGLASGSGVLLAVDPKDPSALYAQSGGGTDAFVAKINPTGSALVYSSYLGGSATDQGSGIAVDQSGNAYVVGSTSSNNFPLKEALQSNGAGNLYQVFVTKLNATGSALSFSTYLGATGFTQGRGVAVDVSGNLYLTGFAYPPFVTSIVDPIRFGEGSYASFIVKIAEAASGLPAPKVMSVAPSFGPPTGGTAVTVHGMDFLPGASVSIGRVPATNIQVINSSTITAITGPHTARPQPVDLVVVNPDGQASALIGAYTYAGPRISSVSLQGKSLSVFGDGFDSGAVILLDGREQKTRNGESSPGGLLVAPKAGKQVAPGQKVTVQVRNSDGSLSEPFSFTRSS